MGLSLNTIVKPQTVELNKKAKIFFDNKSPKKRLYVDKKKPNLKWKDIVYLIKNLKNIYRFPYSIYKTVHLIKTDLSTTKRYASKEIFDELAQLLQSLGVDNYGFFEVTPEKVFKECGVPHKYALVFSSAMDIDAFKTAPSIVCQLEVARVYCQTGNIANKVAEFLQKKGFGASPNHSMGGQLDYSMAAEWAGIGITGRHSMAITKKHGPCHRLSVVYTNIENLAEFINHSTDEMGWVREFCNKCGKCIRKCPSGAIMEAPVVLDGLNPTRIDYEKCCEGFKNYGCGICIKECPFTSSNYEKIKEAYLKTTNR